MCSQLYGGSPTENQGGEDEEGLLDEAYGSVQEYEDLGSKNEGKVSTPRDPRSSVGAFTIFQLIQNAGSALWYLVSLQLPVHDAPGAPGSLSQIWIQVGFLALVALTFVALDRRQVRK